jgi:hypothetical protein
MRFGTEVHEKLNGGIETKLTATIKRKGQKLELLGYLDDMDEGTQVEYKTSTRLWDSKKAHGHGQMKLYALMHYTNTGTIPKQRLQCFETANLGGLMLTGKEVSFDIQYTLKDILEMEARVWKAHDAIIALVEQELKKIF